MRQDCRINQSLYRQSIVLWRIITRCRNAWTGLPRPAAGLAVEALADGREKIMRGNQRRNLIEPQAFRAIEMS